MADFGSRAKDKKTFGLLLVDTDGNEVYQTFTVRGDDESPVLTVTSPTSNSIVCDYSHSDLTLSFKAKKTNGLAMDTSSFFIERKGSTDKWNITPTGPDSNGYYTVTKTIPRSTLKNLAEGNGVSADAQPIFIFSASDVLGNTATDQRTAVLSPLPVLEKITINKPSGNYPAGTKLILQAKFSDSVKVTTTGGTPRLALGGITGTSDVYAKYTDVTGTDTLSFE